MEGSERDYAIEMTGDVCWRFYRRWGQITRRLRLSVNAFLTFPFGRPGYRFDDLAQDDGRSLDMRRCPVADYLGSRGAADLCVGSWCNVDYALAEMWGATLGRSGNLVRRRELLRLPLPGSGPLTRSPSNSSRWRLRSSPHPTCGTTRCLRQPSRSSLYLHRGCPSKAPSETTTGKVARRPGGND